MRFHATLTHTPESCPGPSGEVMVPNWPARAKGVGVELISAVVSHSAHTQFFVVETDDYAMLRELFRPWEGRAKGEILPVRDLLQP